MIFAHAYKHTSFAPTMQTHAWWGKIGRKQFWLHRHLSRAHSIPVSVRAQLAQTVTYNDLTCHTCRRIAKVMPKAKSTRAAPQEVAEDAVMEDAPTSAQPIDEMAEDQDGAIPEPEEEEEEEKQRVRLVSSKRPCRMGHRLMSISAPRLYAYSGFLRGS